MAKENFPQSMFERVGLARRELKFRNGEVIFSQGAQCDAVFYLLSGQVKLTVVSRQGKEAVIALLDKGCFFGEGCLAGQSFRIATATALAGVLVARVEKKVIIATLLKSPEFSEFFLSHVLTRTVRIEEDLIDHLFNSSEKRLARVLLLLANFGKEGKSEPVLGKVSQEMLAEMIGTTRSRVSYFMNKFRKLGFIKYNGTIVVNNSLLSVVLLDKPVTRGPKPKAG